MSDHQPQTVAAKSVRVAFALWFFLGGFGAHRFYVRRPVTATAMLACWLVAFVMTFITLGLTSLFFFPLYVWVVVDVFLLRRWVQALQ